MSLDNPIRRPLRSPWLKLHTQIASLCRSEWASPSHLSSSDRNDRKGQSTSIWCANVQPSTRCDEKQPLFTRAQRTHHVSHLLICILPPAANAWLLHLTSHKTETGESFLKLTENGTEREFKRLVQQLSVILF